MASVAINKFVTTSQETVTLPNGLTKVVKSGVFDFNKLKEVTKVMTKNLNKVIDRNFYPSPEARKSNMRHRPIGIGIQVRIVHAYSFIYEIDSSSKIVIKKVR